jgi:hypothetical protein
MKVLLLHPEDDALDPRWRSRRWDSVIDLGFAGANTYAAWQDHFGCPVTPLPRLEFSAMPPIRKILFSGLGHMLDAHGLDWWELISIRFHEPLERLAGLTRVSAAWDGPVEPSVTRPCFQSRALELLTGRSCRPLSAASESSQKFSRVARTLSNLSFSDVAQIVGDKFDARYRWRRQWTPTPSPSREPVVLLPSAYVNASRTAVSYASSLPYQQFLLVTTRKNGVLADLPANVSARALAAYAGAATSNHECRMLMQRWRDLRRDLLRQRELAILDGCGFFARIRGWLRAGLAVRDAWVRILELEPVSSVLCTDDSNPYTRLPLLLARGRGLPTLVCHHGALDGRHLVKRSPGGTVLAKGEMERDYLVSRCGVPEADIEIGAPPLGFSSSARAEKTCAVFFSEPYELGGGRCGEFYRQVLPPLAEVAARLGCRLVLKLHPQENRRQREQTLRRVLSHEQAGRFQVVEGPLREDLLSRTKFALSVLSTAAVDCAMRGIPVFLCKWLDRSSYGYLDQFAKFRIGVQLSCPAEIACIPQEVQSWSPPDNQHLWSAIESARFRDLLTQSGPARLAAAV